MPELPEVETIRKGLVELVVGREISNVEVYWPAIVENSDKSFFKLQLQSQKIESISRRGKFLVFHLSENDLVSHLRMEGKYEFFKRADEKNKTKHTHVIFYFSDGSQLNYNDVRKFGRMKLLSKGLSNNYAGIKRLGPEPTESSFLFATFYEQLQRTNKAIKPVLLDQKYVAGLGNIYVDEVLWRTKIHPETSANQLSKKQVKQLRIAIIEVLENAIQAGGTTIRSYVNAQGDLGEFQVQLHAYGREGKPCERCLTPIEKIKVAQRGTHFCPHCQKRGENG